MAGFTSADLAAAAKAIAGHVDSVAADLNAADGKLGDGDLGITMEKGWKEVAGESDAFPEDVGMAFLAAAKAFQRVSPSSFGTLVATALMSAAKACKGRTDVPWSEAADLLAGARDAMMARGKGELGAKTVLDATDAMARALAGETDPAAMRDVAGRAVDQALADFRDKPNKMGRARMFGDKSVGLDDPGMLATREMVRGLGV